MTPETYAQFLYEEYCSHADWKNYQGLPCPRWDDQATVGDPEKTLTPAVRSHWVHVATKVLESPPHSSAD
jgi:hypothetical protein